MEHLTSDEVKQGELQILIAFDEIAQANGLAYSLEGGSLLGAIRHKGFIPWDDDIDVMMLRPDYDRLISLIKQGLDSDVFFFSGYEIDGYPIPFIKMFDPRVKVEEAVLKPSIQEFLWIDIFPIDALPSSSKEAAKVFNKAYLLRGLIKTGNYRFIGAGKCRYKRILRMVAAPFVKLFKLNDWALRRLIRLAKSFGDMRSAEYVGMIVWGYGMPSRNPVEVFEGTCRVEFEGHMFPAIKAWDKRLTSLFGDYMQIPPIDQRATHSITAYWAEPGDISDDRISQQ